MEIYREGGVKEYEYRHTNYISSYRIKLNKYANPYSGLDAEFWADGIEELEQ